MGGLDRALADQREQIARGIERLIAEAHDADSDCDQDERCEDCTILRPAVEIARSGGVRTR